MLVSVRDAGCLALVENFIKGNGTQFELFLVLSGTALQSVKIFDNLTCTVLTVKTTAQSGLSSSVSKILKSVSPDFIVASSSGPDRGLDEEVIWQARLLHIPVGLLQDFPGDVNPHLRASPDLVFCSTEFASNLTRTRLNCRTRVVGELKYEGLQYRDLEGLRQFGRNMIEVSEGEKLFTIMLQPSNQITGYFDSINLFVDEFIKTDACLPFKAAIRAHPKSGQVDLDFCSHLAQRIGQKKTVIIPKEMDYDELLCASDVVVSAFSSSGSDAIAVNKLLGCSEINSVFVMNQSCKEWFSDYSGIENIGELFSGGKVLHNSTEVEAYFANIITKKIPTLKKCSYSSVCAHLPSKVMGNIILDYLCEND